jgi:CHAT domain-containing protein
VPEPSHVATDVTSDADLRPAAVASRALQLAALDPAGARALSMAILPPARRRGEWDVVSTAERALGVAAMNLSELDVAIPHLRAAVAAGERAHYRRGVGEARMSLASALVLRGLPHQARREIEAAVHDLDGVPAARAGVQYAAILQELGQDEDALQQLRRVLPVLRRAGDAEWAARGLSNRSLIHATRRALAAAEADLLDARRLCDDHGLELPAAYAEQNLGCVKALRGEVPQALRHFDQSEERYRRFGLLEPSILLDRAEVLLSVRLLDEARATVDAAVDAYRQQKRHVHLPEAQLLRSTVALVQGDTDTACASAAEAIRGFRRLGRTASLALARYARLQALAVQDPRGVSFARAARTADELEAAGWRVPSLEARVLAGRMALARGRTDDARRHLARASRARRSGPADARSRAWLAEALLRRADGRRAAAASALRAGMRIVDEYQAALGATELRAHVSVHRGALARSGLRMALEDSNPRRVLWWAERGRASALLLRRAQPPDDPHLAQDLEDLRSTMAEIEEARDQGDPADSLVQRQVRLERRIRDRCRTLTAGDAAEQVRRRDSLAELFAPLGRAALVEYVELDGLLYAVTVADGHVRLHPLSRLDDVRAALRHLPFALRRLSRPRATADAVAAATAVVRHTATLVDEQLLRPLQTEIADRPLVVVPIGALQSVPWSVLPSCAGRPVTVSPSARLWHQAVTLEPPAAQAPVVVVAGPGLPGAQHEATTVAGLYPGSVVLTGTSAAAQTLAKRMDGAGLLHLAAHGCFRSDNPLFSSLRLADGPFTVYELERLTRAPHSVVLAACDTGRAHLVAGEEILGFGAALLSGGTATLVAPVVPIPDAETVTLMRAYHEGLRSGLAPSEALARAQAGVDSADAAAWAGAAGFVCLGAG